MRKIRLFLASDLGQNITNVFYGLGASVVILGALFKILHWNWAEEMLIAGMGTEAFLFALGSLEYPHKMYEWERIFPALNAAHGETPSESGIASFDNIGLLDALIQSGKINPNDIKKLGEGFTQLNTTASELTKLSGSLAATNTYVENIEKATDTIKEISAAQKDSADSIKSATGGFVDTFASVNSNFETSVNGAISTSVSSLNQATADLTNSYAKVSDSMNKNINSITENSTTSAKELDAINKNLSSINSSYETQLKQATAQIEALKQQIASMGSINSDIDSIKAAYTASVTDSQDYKSEATKLKNQISELNGVYGNMLSALNINS